MNIDLKEPLDFRITIALEVNYGKFYLVNTRYTNGVKLFVRTTAPPKLGLSAMNKKDPSIYIPFFINEWEIDLK